MIGFENRKGQDLHKPYPRCVGRLINMFDLSSGIMPRTKLLTDKPHRDGSPTSRNRSDMVKKPVDSVGVEANPVPNDHRKGSTNRKSCGTPMKKLIAQELSREMESKQKPPNNVVARLMGLDSVPAQQMDLNPKRRSEEGYSGNFPSGKLRYYRQMEDDSHHTSLKLDTPSSIHDKEYKDVYEVWQQPSRAGRFKDRSPLKGRINDNLTEERMALVRQKFTEAKRLATDERLLQSKEFQDALEVLSSNRDLFLKFLEEPNSLFSKHFCEIQTVPSSQTKRITVLKPSKTIEVKAEAHVIKPLYPPVENIDHMNTNQRNSRCSSSIHYRAESIPQPTRIVVLKPNPGTANEMKTTIASPATPPKQAEGRGFNDSLESDGSIESREVAKEITRRMQQYLSSHQRDEALLSSSALSNGYVGDVSSFNEEGCCIASDSEAATPTSRHPWDYNNGFGSPYSISSFSRASSSPEPSVVKEAKKRLSERWAMVTSNGIYEDPNQMRSSSTLGEMLSFPEVKPEEGGDNLNISSRRFCGGEQELKPSIGCFSTGGVKVRCGEDAPRNLPRSKSLPIASSVFKNIELNEVVRSTLTSKTVVPKEMPKSKNGVSSLKGKLSSIFSRSKKSGTEKHIPSPFIGTVDRLHFSAEESCKRDDASSESFCDGHSEVSMLVNSEKFGGASSTPNSLNDGQKHPTASAKGSRYPDTSRASEISRENQDQPSPISVLEAPFEANANNLFQRSTSAISGHPQALTRSSPIESISRTLTRDSSHLGRPLSNSSELSKVLSKECEEQERFAFVQKLLSSASLIDSEDSVLSRWHSLDSPLDPTLLDEFLDRKEEEAKCRERRSNQRLLFDCVNAVLLDIGRSTLRGYYPYARAFGGAGGDGKKCFLVAEEVWRLVRGRFSSVDKQASSCEGENRNIVVEGLVKQDVAGSGWSELMRLEIDEFSKEIGREVLEDLVKEVLADLTDVCFL